MTDIKPYSVLLFLDDYSVYEFVTAADSNQAIQEALIAHQWVEGEPYSVELVIEGHHIDQQMNQ
jgi:hypothetical protein